MVSRYDHQFGSVWINVFEADGGLGVEDPNLKLYHNDYGILNDNNFAFSFRNVLKLIKSEGVPIDGVGIQGHFQSAPVAETIRASLDLLDDFGAPIKITEFDCAIDDGAVDQNTYNTDPAIEAIEADGLRRFIELLLSIQQLRVF